MLVWFHTERLLCCAVARSLSPLLLCVHRAAAAGCSSLAGYVSLLQVLLEAQKSEEMRCVDGTWQERLVFR